VSADQDQAKTDSPKDVDSTKYDVTSDAIEASQETPAESTEAADTAVVVDEAAAPGEVEDTEAAGVTESADTAFAPTPTKRSGKATKIAAGVLALLLVAAAGLTGYLYFFQHRTDQKTNAAAQQTALKAAGDGTVAVLSYAPESLDKDLDTAKSHLTGDFLKYYEDFTTNVVRPAVKQKEVQTEAKVIRSAVSEMHPEQAVVLVFVNQQTVSKDRAEPSLSASSVRVTVDHVNGKWLISSFDPI